jgi:hypothetical protein
MNAKQFLIAFATVTGGYLLAYFVTHFAVTPVQSQFFPEITQHASLLFLPHGVRVLTAWLYGWKSLLLLSPVSVGTGMFFWGVENYGLYDYLAALTGAASAALAFGILAHFGRELRFERRGDIHWRDVFWVGIVASIVNSAGMSLIFDSSVGVTAVRLAGDILGLGALLLVMMYGFRVLRSYGR